MGERRLVWNRIQNRPCADFVYRYPHDDSIKTTRQCLA